MKRMMLAGLAWAAVPGAAYAAPVQAVRADAAVEIARLFAPRDMLMRKTAEAFDKGFAESIKADADTLAAEKQFPGLMAAAGAAARKVVVNAMDAGVGDLQADAAALFAREFTPAEQGDLLVFMRSPVGLKLVAMGDQVFDTERLGKELAEKPDEKLTTQRLMGAVDYGFIAKMTPEELKELMTFAATPTGRKFRTVTLKLQAITVDWVNGLMAKQQQPIQTAVIGAMQAHIAKGGK